MQRDIFRPFLNEHIDKLNFIKRFLFILKEIYSIIHFKN